MRSVHFLSGRSNLLANAALTERSDLRCRFRWLACVGLMCLAGCVQLPLTSIDTPATDIWSGRLSLQVQSEPPQSFYGAFEIKGNPLQGELRLSSPLGNTLLAARWSPNLATLYSGSETRNYASIDALIEHSTGAALPVAALFDWLVGKDTQSMGWTADLTRQPDGHIHARRLNPLPQSELRIVLDTPSP
jgi:outer membrane lipoprotein LolB